jgi:hypothetical protein
MLFFKSQIQKHFLVLIRVLSFSDFFPYTWKILQSEEDNEFSSSVFTHTNNGLTILPTFAIGEINSPSTSFDMQKNMWE